MGFPDGSDDKAIACNVGNLGLIPGSGRQSSTLAWKIPEGFYLYQMLESFGGFISSLSQKFHELDNKVYQHLKIRQKVKYSSTSKL